MASNSKLMYCCNDKEESKKFLYAYENIVMKNKTKEEKATNLFAYLDGKAFK